MKAHWSFKVKPQDFCSDRVLLDAEAAGLEIVVVRVGTDYKGKDRYRIAVREGTVASRVRSSLYFGTDRLQYSLDTGNFFLNPYMSGKTRHKWRWNDSDLLADSVDGFLSAVADQREKEARRVRFSVRGY